jgi:hypothetical protein
VPSEKYGRDDREPILKLDSISSGFAAVLKIKPILKLDSLSSGFAAVFENQADPEA